MGNRFWRAIRDAGVPLGLKESPVQYDRAREAGMITISHTEGDKINALEFWRENIVDLSGGDFVGKEALLRIKSDGGPKRRMVGLVATDPEARFECGEWDMDIYLGDVVVGTTRRVAYSRHIERSIAVGFIDSNHAVPGKRFVLPHAAGTHEIELVNLPFVESKSIR